MKSVIIILTVVCLGLGAGLFIQHHKATLEVQAAEISRDSFSNSWSQVKGKLEETEKVASSLESTLSTRTEALTAVSNNLTKTSTDLAKTTDDLAKMQTDFNAAQAEMKKQQAQIVALENQRDDLTKKMDELNSSITGLETQITDTKKKLAASEGDRNFLVKELNRLQSEKATLVAQFNNLSAVRAQVAKLREEASINQRLAWMQMGVYNQRDKKGAERLLATTPATSKADSRLEIELDQNGRGKTATPAPATTSPNSP
jgi:chromosome segregation ATPase